MKVSVSFSFLRKFSFNINNQQSNFVQIIFPLRNSNQMSTLFKNLSFYLFLHYDIRTFTLRGVNIKMHFCREIKNMPIINKVWVAFDEFWINNRSRKKRCHFIDFSWAIYLKEFITNTSFTIILEIHRSIIFYCTLHSFNKKYFKNVKTTLKLHLNILFIQAFSLISSSNTLLATVDVH